MEPSAFDFYNVAKDVQNRSGRSIGLNETEDCRFRDYFDLSVDIALLAWNRLSRTAISRPTGPYHISCGPFTS